VEIILGGRNSSPCFIFPQLQLSSDNLNANLVSRFSPSLSQLLNPRHHCDKVEGKSPSQLKKPLLMTVPSQKIAVFQNSWTFFSEDEKTDEGKTITLSNLR
jgi:hypothetical protein